MDRTPGSDDMLAEHHQNRIDEDREENGWHCEHCGQRGMTETECMYHKCEDDEEEQEPDYEGIMADRDPGPDERLMWGGMDVPS